MKCKLCNGKGYATQLKGEIGHDDFGGEGYIIPPTIKKNICRCQTTKKVNFFLLIWWKIKAKFYQLIK